MKSLIVLITLTHCVCGFALELPFVKYPFHPTRGILCDQGAESPEGNSHTYDNTLFALDLATPKNSDAAGIYASIDGKVISFDNCTQHNTRCGAGFGNHIKILNDDGILVLYAHLKKSFVKTGDFVKVGQFIGVEGNTGSTGTNNRHLHFSVHSDWRKNGFSYYKKYLGSLPDSVPYRMNICQSKYSTCNGKPVDIRNIKCKRITDDTEVVSTFQL